MRRLIVVVVAVLAVLVAAGALAVVRGDDSELASEPRRERAEKRAEPAKPQRAEAARTLQKATPPPLDLASLTAATTQTTTPDAPIDTSMEETEGDVVRPLTVLPVFATPGKRPFAKVPPQQFQDTWLPVVDREDGWVKVLLPSRPNGASGWLRESRVETARSPYVVRVHLTSRTIDIVYEGSSIGTWPVAIGEPSTPTPPGRTFLLGSVIDTNQSYSPIILPLGSHSDTLDSYGGGPGTVALHGWPDESVFGTAASHGCIRVPAEALDRLSQVPLGTLVVVDER